MAWETGLRPELVPYMQYLVAGIQYLDPSARVTSAYRSREQQAILYRRFLEGAIPGPVAPPGRSYHELGRAIDILADENVLRIAGQWWESLGGRWGGDFQGVGKYDPIHFEA